MTPADVIQLLDEPINLLRSCYLTIAGANNPDPPANGQAAIHRFRVEITNADTRWGATKSRGWG